MEKKKLNNEINVKNLIINFGPQHPAAHGVLRLILELEGEKIKGVDPIIGLLHRGTEKLLESKTILQALPYFDRLDYVSTMVQELCYCESIEKLCFFNVPFRAKIIRIVFCELTRILNHLLAITTHALDVGALTPFLWGFEEREKIMEFYERVSGARLHAAYIRPGGVAFDLPVGLEGDIRKFLKQSLVRFDELSNILANNRIWRERLIEVGSISAKNAYSFGFSGPLLRATGVDWDLRRDIEDEVYRRLNFNIIIGERGDCFDRYLVRLEEIYESIYLVSDCLDLLEVYRGRVNGEDYKFQNPSRFMFKESMEHLIHHFKFFSEGGLMRQGMLYHAVEAPKGEFGILVKVDDRSRFERCKIRAPGFFHLAALNSLSSDLFLADLIAIIGSLDLVFGEIDR